MHCIITVRKAKKVTTAVDMMVSLVVRFLTASGVYFFFCSSVDPPPISHCTEKHQVTSPVSIAATSRICVIVSPRNAAFTPSTELQQTKIQPRDSTLIGIQIYFLFLPVLIVKESF